MLLVYTRKISYRTTYVFKHICTRVLGIEIDFTSVIEEFISHSGPKLSYGKKPLGNELFLQSYGLLTQQGFDSIDVTVKNWEETKCFFSVGELSKLPFDIFSASFYMLSRYEEYLPHVKDEKGRFPATESLAFKEGFLQYPVVDIWAYKFKELLQTTFPHLSFTKRQMTVYNIINASQPFIYKYKGALRTFIGFSSDLFKFRLRAVFTRIGVLFGFKEDPYNTFDWIIKRVKDSSTKLSIFFLLGESINFHEGTNTRRDHFKMLIKNVSDYKPVGLTFSIASLKDFNILKKEKQQLENITNRTLVSSMNTQYLVSLPENYRHLVELEIERDFTMVFENNIGFRGGSCTPFLFYDLDYEIVTPLIIHPLAITTKALNGKRDTEKVKQVRGILDAVKSVNGTFSIVFTNMDFSSNKKNKIWRNLFSNLSGKIKENE